MVPLAIDLATVADLHDQHAQRTVLNVTDHPAIAHSVPPESAEGSGEGLPRTAGVFQTSNALVHEVQNTPGDLPVQLAQLLLGCIGVLNRPG